MLLDFFCDTSAKSIKSRCKPDYKRISYLLTSTLFYHNRGVQSKRIRDYRSRNEK